MSIVMGLDQHRAQITGVIDRWSEPASPCRVPDPVDRRRVNVEVTRAFYERADRIWGPVAADWQSALAKRFTTNDLERIADFLRATVEISRRHMDRLREMR